MFLSMSRHHALIGRVATIMLLFFSGRVHDAVAANQALDPAMRELLAVLDQETEIATHTKMNIDFVPGLVSVLHGKDLRARGVRTVLEALTYVPGIEISSNNGGQIFVIVRGVGRVLASSKIKILLDGVSLTSTLQAASLPLWLPIEIVDRIEMIRGPGSAIYGGFASVGVLNIITRKNEKQLYHSASDKTRRIIGAQYHFSASAGSMDLRFSRDQNDGGRVVAGNDILKDVGVAEWQAISNSPGPVNDAGRRTYLSLGGQVAGYHIRWQWLEHILGDYFGVANALPKESNRLLREVASQSVNLDKSIRIDNNSDVKYKLGWLRSIVDSKQHQIFPPGFVPNAFADGVLGGPYYEEDKFYLQAEFSTKTTLDHELLGGLELSQVKQGETYAHRNYRVNTSGSGSPLLEITNARYTGADNWLQEDLQRSLSAIYLQDQYALTHDLRLTTGIRYDHYDDVGSDITPRIASVYQIDEQQTLKFQFAQSFRPPTFLEMYTQNNLLVNGNADLVSERVNTFEISFSFNDARSIGRASLYHFKVKDIIVDDPLQGEYVNRDEVTANGIEVEYQRDISRKLKFECMVSFVDAQNMLDNKLPNIANFLSSVGVFYTPTPDVNAAIRYRAVSDRRRTQGDLREPLHGYDILDMTLSINDLPIKDLNIIVAAKNVFDADVRYPASMTSLGAQEVVTYKDDYPQLGRELTMSLQYEFR